MGKARHKSLKTSEPTPQPFNLIALLVGAVAVGAFLDTIIRFGLSKLNHRGGVAGKSFPLDMPSDLRRKMETKPGYD